MKRFSLLIMLLFSVLLFTSCDSTMQPNPNTDGNDIEQVNIDNEEYIDEPTDISMQLNPNTGEDDDEQVNISGEDNIYCEENIEISSDNVDNNQPDTVDKNYATLYLSAIDALVGQYGEGCMVPDPYSSSSLNMMSGVFIIRLIDFDDDNQDELYCCYGNIEDSYGYYQAIYGYDGENLIEIAKDLPVANPGTGVEPIVFILNRGNKVYLIYEHEMRQGKYYTVENNELTTIMNYTIDFWQDGDIETAINGEVMTVEELRNTLEDFNSMGVLETIYLDIARDKVADALYKEAQATIEKLHRLSNQ